jgi:hypothetical protein
MILESELEINLAPSIGDMNWQGITSWSQYQQMNIQFLTRMYGNNCKAELGRSSNPTTMLHLTFKEFFNSNCLFDWIKIQKPNANIIIKVTC